MGKVTVVGGGLAGMIAALRLLQRGCEVTIIDAADRVGGKAGAARHEHDFDEHGYHIFRIGIATPKRSLKNSAFRQILSTVLTSFS